MTNFTRGQEFGVCSHGEARLSTGRSRLVVQRNWLVGCITDKARLVINRLLLSDHGGLGLWSVPTPSKGFRTRRVTTSARGTAVKSSAREQASQPAFQQGPQRRGLSPQGSRAYPPTHGGEVFQPRVDTSQHLSALRRSLWAGVNGGSKPECNAFQMDAWLSLGSILHTLFC